MSKKAAPLKKRTPTATSAILRVGDGRGFVVKSRSIFKGEEWLVVTVAHCLPHLPPAHPAAYREEQTYRNLLGPLQGECTISAECRFVDPIADIAVLSQPDNQALAEEADAYDQLVEAMTTLPIAAPTQRFKTTSRSRGRYGGIRYPTSTPTSTPCTTRMLFLDGQWRELQTQRLGCWLNVDEPLAGGMSGSPILDAKGRAIGVVSTEQMNPVIVDCLPLQLLRAMADGGSANLHSRNISLG
jgi:hypothetical protein